MRRDGKPNMQPTPVRTPEAAEIRKALVDQTPLVSMDFADLEARVMAAMYDQKEPKK